jgi:predicted nuclease of restriction endonuclease-like (RecB) superfamily
MMENTEDKAMNRASLLDFNSWMAQVKDAVRRAQIKTFISVNSGLLHLYWSLGEDIVSREKDFQWGDSFLKKMSEELMAEFPDMKGFSHRNLKYIKQWYSFYNQANTIGQQAVAQIGEDVFYSVPWGHHLYILSKCKDVGKACFYLSKVVENNWSRAVLLNFLDTNLYEREGKSINNFSRQLDPPRGDLAQQTLKDPYNFDFLCLREHYMEKDLENGLVSNITRFLLELGNGFAFVGRQVPLSVGKSTLYPDLLFYNINLRCYVVIELKIVPFDSAFIGQLGTYVTAVNHLMKKEGDNDTIGLLICKNKDDVVAQYALENVHLPLGVSEYELSKLIPENYKSSLPSIEDIENELSAKLESYKKKK